MDASHLSARFGCRVFWLAPFSYPFQGWDLFREITFMIRRQLGGWGLPDIVASRVFLLVGCPCDCGLVVFRWCVCGRLRWSALPSVNCHGTGRLHLVTDDRETIGSCAWYGSPP